MARRPGRIIVAAGTNGAGKSSIIGTFLETAGRKYFNPDVVARQLMEQGTEPVQANAVAWKFGFDALQSAIGRDANFAFETTLGGNTIVRELHRAIDAGLTVRVYYVGLASPDLHIARVRARVARGGHDIPERKIRQRYLASHANLLSLVGRAAEIHVYDNSTETATGIPAARLVFRMKGNRIVEPDLQTLLRQTPSWAKPIVAEALRVSRRGSARSRK